MKQTIEGFSQAAMNNLGMDCTDACLLKYIVELFGRQATRRVKHEGEYYMFVEYKRVMADMPILNIKSCAGLAKRLRKICKVGVLKHYHSKEGGSFSCYRLGPEYWTLINGGEQ